MIQTLIRYLRGYVKIRVEGCSPERFLNLCRYHQIYIWGLIPCRDTYEMYVNLKGFRRLRPIVRKTHTKVILVKRCGLPFFVHKYRKRKLFGISLVLCVVLLFLYSGFIWDIHFEGNEKWTNETLLEFLETRNISPHMLKKKVDCAKIAKDIRQEYNDIVWVSASIDGTRLRIQIKENEDTFMEEEVATESSPKDLIASDDGVITSIITRAGVPTVHVGDTVAKGDVLVSGRVEVKNDAGEVTGYQYTRADADISADTQINYSDTINVNYKKKNYNKSQRRVYYLNIGSLTISAGLLKNQYKEYEIHTDEHQIKLGENFYLPVSYGRKIIKSYTSETRKHTEEELQELLSDNFNYFSKELQEKGIQILENSVKIHIDKSTASAQGILYLNQSITEEADTEIIELERIEPDESFGTDN